MTNKLLENRRLRRKLKKMIDNMNEIVLYGEEMKENPHEYIKEKLDLPDYYGENLDALYDCLCGVQFLYVRIENMTEESLRLLREAVGLQKACLDKSDADRIKSLDTRFHEIIYQNCGSTILADTLSPLHKKVQKFRRISIEQGSRAEISVQEHWNIYNAIAAKNGNTLPFLDLKA